MFIKPRLMAPGPTPIPEDLQLTAAQPIIHHRTPEFEAVLKEVYDDLKYLFQTKNPVCVLTSSGTGAMETAVANLLSESDKAIAVNAGKFGERWRDILKAYKCNVISIDIEWGKSVTVQQIKEIVEKEGDVKAVFTTLTETSTCAKHPIQEIGEYLKDKETVFVVDGISGLGGQECYVDDWNVDVMVTGSQKALMLPPGLAFISVSEKAKKLMEKSTLPKYYFSLAKAIKSIDKNTTPYTPAIMIIFSLNKALKMIKKEGIENIFKRHKLFARACQAAVKELGLSLLAENPVDVATSIKLPENINGAEIKKLIQHKYGITMAGGQEHLKGKILRIAHMGYMDRFDLISAIAALEFALKELGMDIKIGAGVTKAMEILLEGDDLK